MRYINVTLNMTLAMVSSQVRVRFPTMEHYVEAGFLVPHEKIIIDHLNEKMEGPKYFVPTVWAGILFIESILMKNKCKNLQSSTLL